MSTEKQPIAGIELIGFEQESGLVEVTPGWQVLYGGDPTRLSQPSALAVATLIEVEGQPLKAGEMANAAAVVYSRAVEERGTHNFKRSGWFGSGELPGSVQNIRTSSDSPLRGHVYSLGASPKRLTVLLRDISDPEIGVEALRKAFEMGSFSARSAGTLIDEYVAEYGILRERLATNGALRFVVPTIVQAEAVPESPEQPNEEANPVDQPVRFFAEYPGELGRHDRWIVVINDEKYLLSQPELEVLRFAAGRSGQLFSVMEFRETDFSTESTEPDSRKTAASRAVIGLADKLPFVMTRVGAGRARRYSLASDTEIYFGGESKNIHPNTKRQPKPAWRQSAPEQKSKPENRKVSKVALNGSVSSSGSKMRAHGSSSEVVIPEEDIVRMYLKEIGKVDLLTKEEEAYLGELKDVGLAAKVRLDSDAYMTSRERRALLDEVRAGEEAQQKFVKANLRLVVSVAKRYQGKGLPLLDLIQEGNLGLMHAVEKFDWRKGFKFSTYATWWIRQAVTRGLANTGRTIRIPVHAGDAIDRVSKTLSEMTRDNGGVAPDVGTLAEKLDMKPEAVEKTLLMLYTLNPLSLDEPVGDKQDAELKDFVGDRTAESPEEAAIVSLLPEQVEKALCQLNEREREVIELRFALKGGEPKTLEEVGVHFGLTRERIRQLESRAISKLRHPSIVNLLQDFISL